MIVKKINKEPGYRAFPDNGYRWNIKIAENRIGSLERTEAGHLASKQTEDLGRKKEVFVSHIPTSFEHLRKDMEAVFQITKGVGNALFKVSFDLGRDIAEIEFCGITQQKDVTMVSTGEGILKEAN